MESNSPIWNQGNLFIVNFNLIEKDQKYFTIMLYYHCNLPMISYNNILVFLNINNLWLIAVGSEPKIQYNESLN